MKTSGLLLALLSAMSFTGIKADDTNTNDFRLEITYMCTDYLDWFVASNYEMHYIMEDVSFFTEDGKTIDVNGKKYHKLYAVPTVYDAPINAPLRMTAEEAMYRFGIRMENGRLLADYNGYMSLLKNDKTGFTPLGDINYIPYEVTDEGELVLYDFNMKTGDKFRSVEGHDDISLIDIKTVDMAEGDNKKLLTFSNGAKVIEGMGCINSPGMFFGWLNPETQNDNQFVAMRYSVITMNGKETVYSTPTKETVKATFKSMLDGKTRWNFYTATLTDRKQITGKTEYTIFADNNMTSKNGKIYRSLCMTGNGETKRLPAMREENGRVYADREEYMSVAGSGTTYPAVFTEYIPYTDNESTELTVYDFNMKTGDKLRSVAGNEDVTVVNVRDTTTADYNTRRMLILSNGTRIVEGIGCIVSQTVKENSKEVVGETAFTTFGDFIKYKTQVYAKSEKDVISDITTGMDSPDITGEKNRQKERIYNISGQRLTQKPTHGIYIINGEKTTGK